MNRQFHINGLAVLLWQFRQWDHINTRIWSSVVIKFEVRSPRHATLDWIWVPHHWYLGSIFFMQTALPHPMPVLSFKFHLSFGQYNFLTCKGGHYCTPIILRFSRTKSLPSSSSSSPQPHLITNIISKKTIKSIETIEYINLTYKLIRIRIPI